MEPPYIRHYKEHNRHLSRGGDWIDMSESMKTAKPQMERHEDYSLTSGWSKIVYEIFRISEQHTAQDQLFNS